MAARVVFTAGFDKKTGKPVAAQTLWENGQLIKVEPIAELPKDVVPIRMLKGQFQCLIRGEGPYDQPWHAARSSAED